MLIINDITIRVLLYHITRILYAFSKFLKLDLRR